MLFIFLVTTNTAKVRLEAIASALSAFFWPVRLMFFMSVLADTAWSPSVHVKTLSTRQPPLAYLFWATGNEVKYLAVTFCTICFGFLPNNFFMTREKMSTEAFGSGSNSKTVIFSLLRSPGDVDARVLSFLGVVEFPS